MPARRSEALPTVEVASNNKAGLTGSYFRISFLLLYKTGQIGNKNRKKNEYVEKKLQTQFYREGNTNNGATLRKQCSNKTSLEFNEIFHFDIPLVYFCLKIRLALLGHGKGSHK